MFYICHNFYAVMVLLRCEWSGHTDPPKKHQNVLPPTQDIALFFHNSTRTVAALNKNLFFRDYFVMIR